MQKCVFFEIVFIRQISIILSQVANFSFDIIFVPRNLTAIYDQSIYACILLLTSKPKLRIDLYGYTFITTVPATCRPKQTVSAKSQCRIYSI